MKDHPSCSTDTIHIIASTVSARTLKLNPAVYSDMSDVAGFLSLVSL